MTGGAVCWNVWGREWAATFTPENTAEFSFWYYGEA